MADGIGQLGWLQGAGSFFQAYGALEAGKTAKINAERARLAAEFEAVEAERAGKASIAVAQRQMLEEQRKGRVLASRALAVAAASGGGASDPTIINILADTEGAASYNAAVALYEGESRARQLRLQAAGARLSGSEAVLEGASRNFGAKLTAGGYGFKGGASLYARYGNNGPSGDNALIKQPEIDV